MRIPLIDRIPFKYALVFATALFVVQQLEHTQMAFSGLTFAFILLSTIAFNAAGGFLYPSGWFIFFNAMLTCIVGLSYKALLGEAAETHLHASDLTMLAYCVGMALIIFVVKLARKFTPKPGLLVGMALGESMKKAALGALLLGIVVQLATYANQESGTLLSAVRQINFFTQMGVLLGTFYEVKTSNGARSLNWIVWVAGIFMFITRGLLSFSKEGLLISVVTWLVTAIVAGYSFSRKQILLIFLFAVFFQSFLVPYSQLGRSLRAEDPNLSTDIRTAEYCIPRLAELRTQYKKDLSEVPDDDSSPHLYDHAEGFFDRLNMLSPDDALIAYTADGNEEGLLPTWYSIANVVPHFIWKDKPFYYIGNSYAREIGMIDEDNDATGVSFSPVADAFHQASFYGVCLIVPPVLFVLFLVMDSLSGDIRSSPWGILFAVSCTHSAPEGMIGGQIYVATYVAFGVVVVALMCKYVLPVVSGIITNSAGGRVQVVTDFKPVLRPRTPPLGNPAQPASENS